jgi:hypothetical protein
VAVTTVRKVQLGLVVLWVALVVFTDLGAVAVAVALAAGYLIFRIGLTVIGSFARPIPPPPPSGELRRVKINFRCTICGTEVRMTVANDEMPDPPRHCLEDMELVVPVME